MTEGQSIINPNPSTYREVWSGFDLEEEGAILLTHESGFYKNEFFGPHKENVEYWESLLDADTTTTPIGVAVLVETSPASGTTPARHHVVVLHSAEKVKSLGSSLNGRLVAIDGDASDTSAPTVRYLDKKKSQMFVVQENIRVLNDKEFASTYGKKSSYEGDFLKPVDVNERGREDLSVPTAMPMPLDITRHLTGQWYTPAEFYQAVTDWNEDRPAPLSLDGYWIQKWARVACTRIRTSDENGSYPPEILLGAVDEVLPPLRTTIPTERKYIDDRIRRDLPYCLHPRKVAPLRKTSW
mmetsp:Transcript_35504/g.85925  ORF Transcript_35504/g.85925 Transcript_35504/m.85925 type:complete len:297 (-) Transcript_35504:289-1179(-)